MTLLPADLHALREDLRRAAVRTNRRRGRVTVLWAASLLTAACAGVALGASLLGSRAPSGVQLDLHRAVRYALAQHPHLRLQTARVVAVAPAATLYSIADRGGNYCAELVGLSHGVIYGFTCGLAQRASNGQLLADAYQPDVSYLVAADGTPPPVVQFGRVPAGTVSARAVYDNGARETIRPQLDRFFLYQPSARFQPLARRMAMTLQFRGRSGEIWSYYEPPPQPLRVDGAQRLSGRVVIDRASQVEIDVAPRTGLPSTRVFVPLHADGSFSWSGRSGNVVYRVTVRDAAGEPVSADAGVLTPGVVRQMSALAK